MNKEANLIQFHQAKRYAISGNNALGLDIIDQNIRQTGAVTDLKNNNHQSKRLNEASAFNNEFYKTASDKQIRDDVVSYLGEYRFEVSEFDYELNLQDDKLIDPASKESMVEKAKRAIELRKKDGLNISREVAEVKGLVSLEKQLKANPKGCVVWFSPPGAFEEGYGKYGFGYTGKVTDNKLKMTAIRLEDPQIGDFNQASQALWGVGDYKCAEELLEAPKVLDLDKSKIKDFIYGNFEIKDQESKGIFEKARKDLEGVITEFTIVARKGTKQEQHTALHVIENLSLELKNKYRQQLRSGTIFLSEYKIPTLAFAVNVQKYTAIPEAVKGSCGISAKTQSNDVFRSIKISADKTLTYNKRDFEFDQSGPCRICQKDVPCGPCKICESCNDKIDLEELGD
jgi:hypothetical protein